MSKIETLWPFILSWEGGFANVPGDRGGATKYGVTISTWKAQGYDKDGDGDIDVNLKYKIEHDTISSRKIVISTKDYSQEDYEKVIKNYIQFSLEESAEEEMGGFEKNNLVMKVLKKY